MRRYGGTTSAGGRSGNNGRGGYKERSWVIGRMGGEWRSSRGQLRGGRPRERNGGWEGAASPSAGGAKFLELCLKGVLRSNVVKDCSRGWTRTTADPAPIDGGWVRGRSAQAVLGVSTWSCGGTTMHSVFLGFVMMTEE